GNFFDRLRPQVGRQNLERVGLKYKIESVTPSGRRVEEVGSEVFHFGCGKTFAGSANRSFGNVEGRGTKAPGRKLFGIVAQATADCQRSFSRGRLRMGLPKIEQVRIGAKIGPRNSALPCLDRKSTRLNSSHVSISYAV